MNLQEALRHISVNYGHNDEWRQEAVALVATCLEQLKRDVANLQADHRSEHERNADWRSRTRDLKAQIESLEAVKGVLAERDQLRTELRQKDLECLEWVRRHEEQRQRAEKAEADAQQAWTLRTEEQEDRRRAETKLTAAEEVIRAVARQLPSADSGMHPVARSDFPEVDEYLAGQA